MKRSYLLSGLPGTGKTSLIQDIAVKYSKDIYYIKLEGFSLSGMIKTISSACTDSIIVFEDLSYELLLDISDTKNNNNGGNKISSQDLLNLFDGMISPFHKNLIFITSNDLTGISKAMLRPGRIDYHIEFTYATKEQVNKIFDKYNITETKPEKYVGKFTTAEILNKIELKEIK